MATWKSRGLRGSLFEEIINRTNELYRDRGTALVQKIPTPITPIDIDRQTSHITLAYFDRKSTVDYIGLAQGIALCFDCKECAADTFALQNIHPHQFDFMERFEEQRGIAFLIIYYSHKDLLYYLPFSDLKKFWDRKEEGGRKSFRFEELDEKWIIDAKSGVLVPFLDSLKIDLESRVDN